MHAEKGRNHPRDRMEKNPSARWLLQVRFQTEEQADRTGAPCEKTGLRQAYSVRPFCARWREKGGDSVKLMRLAAVVCIIPKYGTLYSHLDKYIAACGQRVQRPGCSIREGAGDVAKGEM